MKRAFQHRFGFLVVEIGRLYSQQFDRLAREKLGLSQAQCRLLGVLAAHDEDEPVSQAELAQKVGVSAMAVAALSDRMAAAGWIERRPSPHDRRINHLHMKPAARKALERALAISDDLTNDVLAVMTAAERAQLIALLGKARERLLSRAGGGSEEKMP
ncbi:MAG TPA: MarR family transcriptional regulator [Ramlibacter sp.]|uniref:MarR family winged helix-turn-helix transcriptional regulator n=1 Tax=Ramlibacter sp. TaxID=1917967 RepID=UPI002C92BA45|nr:MarR family transcriptional regulator [Ramlibacter sp.]HVZ43846.1 MarR family transcriptional regulator [Ramlibacter sp.]